MVGAACGARGAGLQFCRAREVAMQQGYSRQGCSRQGCSREAAKMVWACTGQLVRQAGNSHLIDTFIILVTDVPGRPRLLSPSLPPSYRATLPRLTTRPHSTFTALPPPWLRRLLSSSSPSSPASSSLPTTAHNPSAVCRRPRPRPTKMRPPPVRACGFCRPCSL